MHEVDIAIVGAGAAGLAAAIFAGQTAGAGRSIVLLDGAKNPGAKILVAGGGRCNVTHEKVTPEDYNGGPRTIVRKVLAAFGLEQTLEWMKALGVPLKLEPTGKYFPMTDQARTVLDALLRRVREAGVETRFATRVTGIQIISPINPINPINPIGPITGFELTLKGADRSAGILPASALQAGSLRYGESETLRARRVIFATGGRALPKSGSDGAGLEFMRALGHTIVPATPALSPLVLRAGPGPAGRFAELSGLTLDVRLALASARGRPLYEWTGSMVFTHFGVSGPAALNVSRHWLRERLERPADTPRLTLGHPALRTVEEAGAWLLERARRHPRQAVWSALNELYPERLARLLAEDVIEDLAHLPRERRREVAGRLAGLVLDVEGDRGYTFAEAMAGGVDLREVDARTMQSRKVPGLYLCGEILDVDGRLGGFNFQWAWSSGCVAGRGVAAGLSKIGRIGPIGRIGRIDGEGA